MLVWGGTKDGGNGLASGWRVEPHGGTAMPIAQEGAPAARHTHVAGWLDHEMSVWSGVIDATGGARYDPASNTWTTLPELNQLTPRTSPHAAVIGGRWVIWGGAATNGQPLTDGRVYDPASNTWDPIADAPWAAREAGSAATDAALYVWGGFDGADPKGGLAWLAAQDNWVELPNEGAPLPRSNPHVLWLPTLDELVVWGGSGADIFTDGGRFNVVDWKWKPLSTVGAPAKRYSTVATIVGANTSRPLLVVFGGVMDLTPLDSGGVYDFTTDTWSALPKDECAPGPREGHTVTALDPGGWQALVWGGVDGGLDGSKPLVVEQGWVLTVDE